MSRTKIVATYGPACEAERTFRGMLRAGLDVVRLNLSHLDPCALGATVARIRRIAAKAKLPVAVLADMPGPKIRCTVCDPERFVLKEGDAVAVSAGKGRSTPREIVISYRHLLDDVHVKHELAINDGLVLLRVEKVRKRSGHLECVVLRGGEVASRKGVSFLHSTLRIKGLTQRDRQGIRAACATRVDFIALSFVRSAADVEAARRILRRAGTDQIPLVAKIEQREAIDRLEEILDVSNGLMVARGDMGIERPLEEVPLLQKDIIARCNEMGKFVITATQMLESMVESALPTRAEVTDVANAILDGTDAVMLSAETAIGRAPARVVETMNRIAQVAESRVDPAERLRVLGASATQEGSVPRPDLDEALARAACRLALDANLDALVCLSLYGSTARRISRLRPRCPIYILNPYEDQRYQLALNWGLEIIAFPEAGPSPSGRSPSPGSLIEPAIRKLRRRGLLKAGDRIALLAGIPLDFPGGTNWLRVVEI